MKKRKVVLVFSMIFASVLIVGLISFAVVKTVLKNRRNSQFYYELTQIDQLITDGNLIDAAAQVSLLENPPIGVEIGMDYLKRAFLICDGLKDYSYLLKPAQKVHAINKPVQEFSAVYVYALLRNNHIHQAFSHSKELKNRAYSSLVAEAYLRASSKELDETTRAFITNSDMAILDLQDFDNQNLSRLISIYEGAIESSSDIRLIKNLVLLYCAQGEFQKAWQIAVERLKSSAPFLYMQVGYDASQFEEVLFTIELLEDKYKESDKDKWAQLLLLKSDLYLHLGKPIEALFIYKMLIASYPDYSIVPFKNIVPLALSLDIDMRIAHGVTDSELYEIFFYLLDSKVPYSDIYTKDMELVIQYVELLSRLGKTDSAIGFLNRYINNDIKDVNSQLLLIYHNITDSKKIDYYISQLDFLMHKDPDNELIPITLAYYLLPLHDRKSQLENVVRISRQRFNNVEWVEFYGGYLSILGGNLSDFKEAASIFERLYNKYQRWEYAKALGEIYSYISDLPKAIKYALEAENRLLAYKPLLETSKNASNSQLKSDFAKVKSLQGRIFEKQQKLDDARNAYGSALSYDASNIDAILSLQRLIKQ